MHMYLPVMLQSGFELHLPVSKQEIVSGPFVLYAVLHLMLAVDPYVVFPNGYSTTLFVIVVVRQSERGNLLLDFPKSL